MNKLVVAPNLTYEVKTYEKDLNNNYGFLGFCDEFDVWGFDMLFNNPLNIENLGVFYEDGNIILDEESRNIFGDFIEGVPHEYGTIVIVKYKDKEDFDFTDDDFDELTEDELKLLIDSINNFKK